MDQNQCPRYVSIAGFLSPLSITSIFIKILFFFVARPSASDFPFSLIFQSFDPLHMKSLAMRNYGTYQQVGGCWRRHFGRCGSGLSAPQPKLKRRTDIFYYLSQMSLILSLGLDQLTGSEEDRTKGSPQEVHDHSDENKVNNEIDCWSSE